MAIWKDNSRAIERPFEVALAEDSALRSSFLKELFPMRVCAPPVPNLRFESPLHDQSRPVQTSRITMRLSRVLKKLLALSRNLRGVDFAGKDAFRVGQSAISMA